MQIKPQSIELTMGVKLSFSEAFPGIPFLDVGTADASWRISFTGDGEVLRVRRLTRTEEEGT